MDLLNSSVGAVLLSSLNTITAESLREIVDVFSTLEQGTSTTSSSEKYMSESDPTSSLI